SRQAIMMIHSPEKWLRSVEDKGHGIQISEAIARDRYLEEYLIMTLRKKEGIGRTDFQYHFGKTIEDVLPIQKLELLESLSFLERTSNAIRVTPRGALLLNRIIEQLC
ncbi:MAG: hypothetical protein Q8O19_00540, partial [Rectinemataceae bacterium]|nr:hypothetical protein [Rectinemataceae bacterium]